AYCLVVDEKIAGVAVLQTTPDPNYAQIAGRWHNTRDQYASIHRFAVRGDLRGQHLGQNFMFKLLARGMLQGISNFRIDTHVANQRMQGLISGAAFRYRGVVQVDQTKDGERLAYELNL
ncbi:GNAT family N-acetyltransferase, partial [Lactobacillus sp. XV13L]|nr:GNAT family N-acetyltransferase [Lactobacillus sp. XV13L]